MMAYFINATPILSDAAIFLTACLLLAGRWT